MNNSSSNSNSNTDSSSSSCCPLCCNEYTIADTLYPIYCPTISCYFTYCSTCIQSFIQSYNDGYSIASDGSNQVKVSIRCPQCRSSYRTTTNNIIMNTTIQSSPPSVVSLTIVTAILKLRHAAMIVLPITSNSCSSSNYKNKNSNNDSYMTASQLAFRNEFIRSITISELHDATRTIQNYYDSIDNKDEYCGTIPTINTTIWEQYMNNNNNNYNTTNDEKKDDTTTTDTDDNDTTAVKLLSRDPTLFIGGLDELYTIDEQEFITQLFISGNVQKIVQAAYVLHSSTNNLLLIQQQQQQKQQRNDSTTTTMTKKKVQQQHQPPKTTRQIEYETKIRKLYPLPIHMPRVVTIQPYNPIIGSSSTSTNTKSIIPIKFVKSTSSTVSTTTTSGAAGMNNTTTTTTTSTNSTVPTTQTQQQQQQLPSTTSFFQRFKLTSSKTTTSTVSNNNSNSELMIASVHGIAGRVGLRRGDIITHINHEPISTYNEYVCTVLYIYDQYQQQQQQVKNDTTTTELLTITVNAHEQMAQQLRSRAKQMKANNVRF